MQRHGHFVDNEQVTVHPFHDPKTKRMLWVVSDDLTWVTSFGNHIIIPRGFETDLGSIPALLRWLFRPTDPLAANAYVLHDWLLEEMKRGHCTSQYAASQMYEAMAVRNVPVWSRKAQFIGVCIGIAKDEW